MSKTRKNTRKNRKLSKTKKSTSLDKQRVVFERFEEEYERSIKEGMKKKNKKFLSQVEVLLDKSRNAIFKKQNSGDLWQAPLVKLFQVPFTPSKIKANDDYYTYINYRWLKNTEYEFDSSVSGDNKKYFSQIDEFRTTQDKTYKDVLRLIDEYVKKYHDRRAKLVKNVRDSFLTLNNLVRTKKHVTEFTNMYNTCVGKNDLWGFLADINRNDIISWGCPIRWQVNPDDKNAKIYKSMVSFPQLSLFDLNVYFDDNTGLSKTEIANRGIVRKKYQGYINDIFSSCLGNGHGLKAQDVFDCEVAILNAMGCDSVKKDSPDFYNVVKRGEALEYGFDWDTFTRNIGYKKAPETFICGSLNYLKCMCKELSDNWTNDKWKAYWYYIFLRQLIRFDKKLLNIHYEFKGKFLTGLPVNFPYELYPVFGLSVTFNTLLANEYVDAYKNDEIIQYVENMGNDLITVFKRIITRNNWMSPSTKKAALLKLEHINLIIGQPKKLREDPLLDYRVNDPWHNMVQITRWRTEKFIDLDGKGVIDIPMIDWANTPFKLTGYQPYIVNAFYTPTQNSIYIPLAYLQAPFIDLQERGIEYNLTHLGYTLGHEMSHALDDTGSKYDYLGNLHNWWTDSDRKHYKSILDDIQKQYEAYAARDGIKFDASIGLGEDVADISGLAICEEYLKDFQDKNDDIVPVRSLSFQAFYVYFAVQQRQHIYKSALKIQLLTNPHPLDKYRTNVPLSRLEIFRNIYNVKKGDGMWWPDMRTVF
jgi:putative endopeptidase